MPQKAGSSQEELTDILNVINNLLNSDEKATIDTISSHLSSIPPTADRLLKILNEAVSSGSLVKSMDGESYQLAHSLRPLRRSNIVQNLNSTCNKSRRLRVSTKTEIPNIPTPSHFDATTCVPPSKHGIGEIIPVCSFCFGDEDKNSKCVPEEMIACWGCGRSGHPSCLLMTPSMLQCVKRLRWYCVDCKRCTLCHYASSNADRDASLNHSGDSPDENTASPMKSGSNTDKDNDLLLCDNCDRGYHLSCVLPQLSEPPAGTWICPICDPYNKGYVSADVSAVGDISAAPVLNSCDPRLRAAALCDVLTDYEVRLIRKALKGGSGGSRGRPPKLLRPLPPPKSPTPVQSKNKASTTLVQKTITNWAVRTNGKPRSEKNTACVESKASVSPVKTRRRSIQIGSPISPLNDRTMRSATRHLSTDSLSISPPPAKRHRQSSRILSATTPLHIHITDNSNPKTPIEVRAFDSPPSANRGSRRRSHELTVQTTTASAAIRLVKSGIRRLRRGRRRKLSLPSIPFVDVEQEVNSVDTIAADCVDGGEKPVKIHELCVSTKAEASDAMPSTGDLTIDAEEEEDTELRLIKDTDRNLFSTIQVQVQKCLPQPLENSKQLPPPNNPRLLNTSSNEPELLHLSSTCSNSNSPPVALRYPPRIQIGKYRITTWYSAPYPSEYARLNLLYICEFCLKYIKTENVYSRHIAKCTSYYPPGNEIYRRQNISIFEVDGYTSKLYCQQLCLLAKLFLDHKTLYYDVEPFLFYVATIHDQSGCHVVGYFSKEKRSSLKYNLSCIMVLPPYQKQAFGRFLIDFSYLLTRIEGTPGSPEKPLSDLGHLSYESYWRSKVLPYIISSKGHDQVILPEATVREISEATGILVHDVVATLQQIASGVQLHPQDGRPMLVFDIDALVTMNAKYEARAKKWIPLDHECLRWSPLTHHQEGDGNLDGHASQVASPRAVRDGFNSPPSSADCVKSPVQAQVRTSTASLSTIRRPHPQPSPATQKRGRGRPPRRITTAAAAATTTTTQMIPSLLTPPQTHSPPSSILLDAFPLPSLDLIDSTPPKGDIEERRATSPPMSPCKNDDSFWTPNGRPPDSPPSGGAVPSGAQNREFNRSTPYGSSTTTTSSQTPTTSSSTSAGDERARRASSRGRRRRDSRLLLPTSFLGTRRVRRSPAAMANSRDIRGFGVSSKIASTPLSESFATQPPSLSPRGDINELESPTSFPNLFVLSSPAEIPRSVEAKASPPLVSLPVIDLFGQCPLSPSDGVNEDPRPPPTLTAANAASFVQNDYASVLEDFTAPDLAYHRPYSLPQMHISTPPSPALSDPTDVEVGVTLLANRWRGLNFHCAAGCPKDRLKCNSFPELSIHADCDDVDGGLRPEADDTPSVHSLSTCPMRIVSPSHTVSEDSMDSENTMPMLLSNSERGTQLQIIPRLCSQDVDLKYAHLNEVPPWEKVHRFRGTSGLIEESRFELVKGEEVYDRADACQIQVNFLPPAPCSTDSFSSSSPPFVFHPGVSPAVDFMSIGPFQPGFSLPTSTVPEERQPRPPSPVFPERPVSPIVQPKYPNFLVSAQPPVPVPAVYPYNAAPVSCCCPVCFHGVSWMGTCQQFSCCLHPGSLPPFLIDPISGAPVLTCCLPMQPAFPTAPSTISGISFAPQLPPPSPSSSSSLPFPSSTFHAPVGIFPHLPLGMAPCVKPPASFDHHQQVPPFEASLGETSSIGQGEWIFGAHSAFPLQG